jgi:hypothetical protein
MNVLLLPAGLCCSNLLLCNGMPLLVYRRHAQNGPRVSTR